MTTYYKIVLKPEDMIADFRLRPDVNKADAAFIREYTERCCWDTLSPEIPRKEGETFEDSLRRSIQELALSIAKYRDGRDLAILEDEAFEIDCEPYTPDPIGKWQAIIQPIRLVPGRYYGPYENCYPDEWVEDGPQVAFTVHVEREED